MRLEIGMPRISIAVIAATSFFSWISGAKQCIYGFPMSGSGRRPYEVLNCLDIDSAGKIHTVICNYQFRFSQLFGQVCVNKHEIQQKL